MFWNRFQVGRRLMPMAISFAHNYPSTGNISSCFFYSGGINFLMQLQFLAPVELFFKQLKGLQFLTRAESIFFYLCSFCRCVGLSCVHFFY